MDKKKWDRVMFIMIFIAIIVCMYLKYSDPWNDNHKVFVYRSEEKTTSSDDLIFVTTIAKSQGREHAVSTTTVSANIATSETTSASGPLYININTADAEELSQLDGIGEVLSARIVNYREMNGNFRNVEEIMQVHGIGEGIFLAIYPYIYVEDPVYDAEIISDPSDADEDNYTPDDTYTEPETNEDQLSLEDVIPIDINTADVDLLMLLPFVTEDIANKIIQFREDIGGYSHPYEIYYIGDLEDYQINEISQYVVVGK